MSSMSKKKKKRIFFLSYTCPKRNLKRNRLFKIKECGKSQTEEAAEDYIFLSLLSKQVLFLYESLLGPSKKS